MVPVLGNVTALLVVHFGDSTTWSQVNANTTSEQTVTVYGLRLNTDKIVGVTKPTHQTGLGIVGWRISADDTLAITFMNNTGSGITPTASEGYNVTVARREGKIADAVA